MKLPVISLFYDLSKAFDTIDHDILLIKLKYAGIKGNCLKLIINYLSNRVQYCKVNGSNSSMKEITHGVPQGSILGPLFFILYINDVVSYINDINVLLYADDTVFYLSDPDPIVLQNKLSDAALRFSYWCKINKLTLNLSKSKILCFNGRAHLIDLKIVIDDIELEIVNEYKYLGILLDSKLNFESHLKSLKQRMFSRLMTLQKIRWTISEKDASTLYKSCIMPFLDQGDIYYSCAKKESLKSLQTQQNRALKIIIGKKKWVDTKSAHAQTNIAPTTDRRNLNLLCFAHKLSYKPYNLKPHGTRSMRSNRKLLLLEPRSYCQAYDKSFVANCRKLWNSLPEEIKKIRDISSFKIRVKTELKLANLNFPE